MKSTTLRRDDTSTVIDRHVLVRERPAKMGASVGGQEGLARLEAYDGVDLLLTDLQTERGGVYA